MPLLARMLQSPLSIDVRRGAVASLGTVLADRRIATEGRVALVVGPEGGLSERDLATLRAAGFQGLRLGPRILRTETAGLTALAALQSLHGDLG